MGGPSVNNHRDFPQSTVKLPSKRCLQICIRLSRDHFNHLSKPVPISHASTTTVHFARTINPLLPTGVSEQNKTKQNKTKIASDLLGSLIRVSVDSADAAYRQPARQPGIYTAFQSASAESGLSQFSFFSTPFFSTPASRDACTTRVPRGYARQNGYSQVSTWR